MRFLSTCLVTLALAWGTPAQAQRAIPSGISVTRDVAPLATIDVMRPQGVTWIDLSGGLLGAAIGVLIALTICDDEPDRSCPVGTPVIGGAIGGLIGVAVARGVRR